MKIHITSKKPVLTQHGRFAMGSTVEVQDQLARFLIERGDAVAFEVKEAMDRPLRADGAEVSLSALQVVPASLPMIASESEHGAKKRGRPRKIVV